MLPLHRLSLTLWFIMVHPGLFSFHTSMEKSICFTSMTVQMLLTNRLPCTLVIIGQLPSDPSATHFPIPEVIMDNIVRRAVTHVEFYGSFINSNSPLRKASGAYVQLYPVWKISRISIRTKLRIFCSNVKSVLLYGSETWKEMKTTTSKLQTFVDRCLRRIMNIHWPNVISIEEVWRRAEEIEMSIQIKIRKWKWIRRTLRKGNETIEREVLDWNPQGKRRRGRPRHTWRRTANNEALEKGKNWNEVKRMAGNRTRWRCFVDALCPLRYDRNS